jgi:hypothetical protein
MGNSGNSKNRHNSAPTVFDRWHDPRMPQWKERAYQALTAIKRRRMRMLGGRQAIDADCRPSVLEA